MHLTKKKIVTMQYKYRWYYAASIFLSLIISGFFYSIQPAWTELITLQENQQHLRQQWGVLRQFSNQSASELNLTFPEHEEMQPVHWEDIFTLAYESGLSIQSFNLVPQSEFDPHTLHKIHLIIRGDFLQITEFLSRMTKELKVIVMTDFSYTSRQENKFIISMDVLLGRNSLQKLTLNSPTIYHDESRHNPFCLTANELILKNEREELLRTPLAHIQMIGYLQQDNRVMAIVLSPSGAVFDINIHSSLGAEQGVVAAITPHYLIVKINGKEQRIINMRRHL
jgi:Tfp pilus assembly protein PilO